MSTGPNPILASDNTYIGVTNFAGYTGTGADGAAMSLKGASFIPLTTSNGTATGQICLAVRAVGSAPATGGTFTSATTLATGNGSVAAGVLGWSITAISGTVTVNGASIPVGATVSGGGYNGYVLGTAVPYTVTSGSALVATDTPV